MSVSPLAGVEVVPIGSIYPGRRGAGIHAISAIDIALHNLAGTQLERPGGAVAGGQGPLLLAAEAERR